jgi:hypothetical protein
MRLAALRAVQGGLLTLFVAALATAPTACGSRTGLLVPDDETPGGGGTTPGGGTSPGGGTQPGGGGPGSDAGPALDAAAPRDAGPMLDALPPIDVAVPPNTPVAAVCADAGAKLIYLISEQYDLFSFNPPTGALAGIGHINCPTTGVMCPSYLGGGPPTPFSMAVDELGFAYIVYCDGELFQVSTADGHCEPTGFASDQSRFPVTFGMAFTQNPQDGGETLYVAGDIGDGGPTPLGSINPTTLDLSVVGPFVPSIPAPELTGTAAGALFGFYEFRPTDGADQAGIAQVDPSTARVIANSALPGVEQGGAWAFAFWAGDFYLFTAPAGGHTPTLIQRYQPADGTIVDVSSIPDTIVGAGVSTCAPQQ